MTNFYFSNLIISLFKNADKKVVNKICHTKNVFSFSSISFHSKSCCKCCIRRLKMR